MTHILHCVSSYPDPIASETQASSLLLELTADRFTHNVYSFKRTGWRGGITAIPFDDKAGNDHRAMIYGAPPKGLRLKRAMDNIARWIISDAQTRGLKPDIVHAHKVSMDGLVGVQVAAHFGVPLMLSVQANTDTRIIAARSDLRATFREIWQDAAMVFPFAPCAETAMVPLLGVRHKPVKMLPCPTRADTIIPPNVRQAGQAPVILTAFHLAHYGNKNIRNLLKGVAAAAHDVPDIRLDIIGGGDAAAFSTVSEMIRQIAPDHARLLGTTSGGEIQDYMNNSTAFAMLSLRESYGMVYAESLLAGTPCLHSSGRGIDGMLPNGEITLGVDPTDTAAIAQAIVRLCRNEQEFKSRISIAQDAGKLDFMTRKSIAESYIRHTLSVVDA